MRRQLFETPGRFRQNAAIATITPSPNATNCWHAAGHPALCCSRSCGRRAARGISFLSCEPRRETSFSITCGRTSPSGRKRDLSGCRFNHPAIRSIGRRSGNGPRKCKLRLLPKSVAIIAFTIHLWRIHLWRSDEPWFAASVMHSQRKFLTQPSARGCSHRKRTWLDGYGGMEPDQAALDANAANLNAIRNGLGEALSKPGRLYL